jgi:hypothetical protein
MACGRITLVLLEAVEAQAFRGFPLGLGHRLDAAAPDLAQEGGAVDRKEMPAATSGVSLKPAMARPK